MKSKLFGTDGIRGTANTWPLLPDVITRIAQVSGSFFLKGDHRHTIVIGKDTRLSGYMLEPALTAGFVSIGMDVVLVGPMPTPAISMLIRSLRADCGVMISASHNPYQDNGIKFFGPDGYKLDDSIEAAIEKALDEFDPKILGHNMGKARRLQDASGRYIEYVKSTFPKKLRLDGLRIVVDCANGAAYKIAPSVLWELGADVIPVAIQPDGSNINANCGATHPSELSNHVKAYRADIGIALDGDADRVILVDENGRIVDGDHILAAIAMELKRCGSLPYDTIVSTIMSNMGLEVFLREKGISLHRTPVGDRHVSAAMRTHGYILGGEQSGHIIMGEYNLTGDGLVAALQVLAIMVESKKPLSSIFSLFSPMPQLLQSVPLIRKDMLKEANICAAIEEASARLQSDGGRLLIRKSGTEPVVRIMGESNNITIVEDVISSLISELQS